MRRAFTVVELLVVIAIIGVLMAIIIPAVQFAREAARKTKCQANLKQIAMAAIQHNTSFEYYPNAGGIDGNPRSVNAAGIPYGALQQDWGVFYQILPYIEQKAAFDSTPAQAAATKVPVYFCPTRRPPMTVSGSTTNGLAASDARGGVDYAGNGGEIAVDPMGNVASYIPMTGSSPSAQYLASLSYQNGVIIPRPNATTGSVSERITGSSIRDGLSNVIMFGERQYNRKPPAPQLDEDNGFINGWSYDTIRFGFLGRPAPDRVAASPSSSFKFGGPHSGVVMIALCDGSVRPLVYDAMVPETIQGTSYTADETFRLLCNRRDGKFPQYIQK